MKEGRIMNLEVNEIEMAKLYMEQNYPETYKRFKTAIDCFECIEFREHLEIYYLMKVKNTCHYDYNYVISYTNSFCNAINEINHRDIEHYLEYCLEFHEDYFEQFLLIVYDICLKVNMVLKDICRNFIRYGGRKDRENMLEMIFSKICFFDIRECELLESIQNIIEIEKEHILNCYELAKNGETFCECCAPWCYVEGKWNKKRTLYKRTTPFRI